MRWRWWGLGFVLLGATLTVHGMDELFTARTTQASLLRQYTAARTTTFPSKISAHPTPAPAARPIAPPCCLLTIPAIGLRVVVLQGTTEAVLAQAPGHLLGSAGPGQENNMVISAHNVLFFRHLDQLRPGDPIFVTSDGKHFTYVIRSTQVIPLQGGSIVMGPLPPTLTLTSCYPLNGSILHPPWRFVVTARLQSVASGTIARPGQPEGR